MHETIYETLSLAQRQNWHTGWATGWLSAGRKHPLELIASHYLRGVDMVKAAQFACGPGQSARIGRLCRCARIFTSRYWPCLTPRPTC